MPGGSGICAWALEGFPRARNVLLAKPQATPSWEREDPWGGALTGLLGYGVQIGKSKGLSRKRSLAMTKRPASTQKQLRA